mmetsp:Transcript_98340/g.283780  ORF Transcript_98340/g.283780 Transcript_98340/m.283780 type:complete len:350 (-) Transcript_98340:999-2048(-)
MRRAEGGNVRPEGARPRHLHEAHLPGVAAVLQRKQRDVLGVDFHHRRDVVGQLGHLLLPPHLHGLVVRDLCEVPEARHLADVSLEDQSNLYLQLLLELLLAPLLGGSHLPIATLDHLGVRGARIRRGQDLLPNILADVDKHISVVDAWPCRHCHRPQILRRPVEVVPSVEIAACVVVIYGGELAARGDGVVIELQPATVQVGADVRVVVPAVDVAAMHHDCIEQVHASTGGKVGQVETLMELESRVQLDHVHLLEVEVEALQLQVQHRREREEADALLRPLLAVPLCLISVVALQSLLRRELSQRLFDVAQLLPALALDVELDVIEGLVAARLVVHIDALDVVFHLALE